MRFVGIVTCSVEGVITSMKQNAPPKALLSGAAPHSYILAFSFDVV